MFDKKFDWVYLYLLGQFIADIKRFQLFGMPRALKFAGIETHLL